MRLREKPGRPVTPPPSNYRFPDPRRALGPQGIVGVGADFAPGTLHAAYRSGIFPWPAPDMGLVPWCSPDPRMLHPLDAPPHWSRSLRRAMRTRPFRVTVDEAFEAVIDGCADREDGTWIVPELRSGFVQLHEMGWAHSLEVWNSDTGALVGGIYGLALGAAFIAESMFHRQTDASKVAFARLVELLYGAGFRVFDGEVETAHLASLGCVPLPRAEYLELLRVAVEIDVEFPRL